MGPCNEVRLSGVLESVTALRRQRWTCCTATIECDGRFPVQLYATSEAASLLMHEFHKGDYIVVRGHLSMSPRGEFQVSVRFVALCEGRPRVFLENRPRIAEERI